MTNGSCGRDRGPPPRDDGREQQPIAGLGAEAGAADGAAAVDAVLGECGVSWLPTAAAILARRVCAQRSRAPVRKLWQGWLSWPDIARPALVPCIRGNDTCPSILAWHAVCGSTCQTHGFPKTAAFFKSPYELFSAQVHCSSLVKYYLNGRKVTACWAGSTAYPVC